MEATWNVWLGLGIMVGAVCQYFISMIIRNLRQSKLNDKIPCAICDGDMTLEQYQKFLKIVRKKGE